jgi:hypothetical protein
MCHGTYFVEDHVGLGQGRRHRREVRRPHVGADGVDTAAACRPLLIPASQAGELRPAPRPSSPRAARPHDWSASTGSRSRSAVADGGWPAPWDRQTRSAPSDCRRVGSAAVAGDRRASRQARPTGGRATSGPSRRGRGWCDGHSHCTCIAERRAGRRGSAVDDPTPALFSSGPPHDLRPSRESRYTLAAIPRVLPWCWHIKRRQPRVVRCQWDRLALTSSRRSDKCRALGRAEGGSRPRSADGASCAPSFFFRVIRASR